MYINIDSIVQNSTSSSTINNDGSTFVTNFISGNSSVLYYNNNTNTIKKNNRISKKTKGDKNNSNNINDRLETSPLIVFKIIKNKLNKTEDIKLSMRLEKICQLMEEFVKSGQIAMKDLLDNKFGYLIREQELNACGFNKFITKTLLEKFINLTKRKLELTPIKNYARIIPKKVIDLKEKADSKKLFDGYVILHTASKDSTMLTEAERKDPILFGIINNSPKLYFIADWEDELCDLKFSEVIDTLSLNNDQYKMESAEKELQKVIDTILLEI